MKYLVPRPETGGRSRGLRVAAAGFSGSLLSVVQEGVEKWIDRPSAPLEILERNEKEVKTPEDAEQTRRQAHSPTRDTLEVFSLMRYREELLRGEEGREFVDPP